LRVPATAKAKLVRAAAPRNTDLTNFVRNPPCEKQRL